MSSGREARALEVALKCFSNDEDIELDVRAILAYGDERAREALERAEYELATQESHHVPERLVAIRLVQSVAEQYAPRLTPNHQAPLNGSTRPCIDPLGVVSYVHDDRWRFAIGQYVRHRGGNVYRIEDRSIYEPTAERCYTYRGVDGVLWVRPRDVMEDGRFAEEPNPVSQPLALSNDGRVALGSGADGAPRHMGRDFLAWGAQLSPETIERLTEAFPPEEMLGPSCADESDSYTADLVVHADGTASLGPLRRGWDARSCADESGAECGECEGEGVVWNYAHECDVKCLACDGTGRGGDHA